MDSAGAVVYAAGASRLPSSGVESQSVTLQFAAPQEVLQLLQVPPASSGHQVWVYT